MLPWDCCRTCLSSQSLNPIFSSFGQNEKYMFAIFTAFGIKIEPNDNLPQKMCTTCIEFVNTSKKFRKKAEESLKELLERLQSIEINDSKSSHDTEKEKSETSATIDMFDNGLDFGGYDDEDDVTLDNFQQKCNVEAESGTKNQVEFECNVQDVQKPIDMIFDGKKKRNTTAKPAKRKPRKKTVENGVKDGDREKETVQKKERVREEVECEYCHKRLSSRLSLRNHYKIHTGFDLVCEHCGKKFITRRPLLMHCRAKHGYEKTDKCSYCDYKASNAEQVKIHERLHTGEKPYSCTECGAAFHRKTSYLQHVAIHLPEKTVQCEQCPARFKSVTLMRIHSYRHRGTAASYRCGECGAAFRRRRSAVAHARRAHALSPSQAVRRIKQDD